MKADTTRRPLLPACAKALRMKRTRGSLKKWSSRRLMRLQVRRQLHSSGQALGGDVPPTRAQEAQEERLPAASN
jgi:hypothetical protein